VAAYYGNRAAAFIALGKFREALSDSLESVRLDPKFVKGHMRVGKCYLQRGEYERAEAAYKKTLEFEPSNAQVKADLEQLQKLKGSIASGQSALASGEVDKAMLAFTRVLMTTPDAVGAKRGCAACHILKKNYVKATELLRDVLSQDPEDEEAHLLRAETLYYTGVLESAVKMFLNLLELDPDNKKIRVLLKKAREVMKAKHAGDAAFRAQAYNDAITAYSNALAIDPELDAVNSKIYCNRAACYSSLQQWQDALTDCNQALIMDDKYTRAYIRRAKCHAALESHQEAVYDWNKAKELDPENKEILTGLRDAQRALKKAERKDWYKILEISPNATDADIKRAYRLQALKWHPDKHNETPEAYAAAEAKFKDITEANTVLSDPKARMRFDNGEDLEDTPQFGGGGFTPDMFASFFGGGGGGGGGGGFPGGFHFGGYDDSEYSHGHGHSGSRPKAKRRYGN